MTLQKLLSTIRGLLRGSKVDLKNKRARLTIPGIVTIDNIPLQRTLTLVENSHVVEEVLCACFLQRQTAWAYWAEVGVGHANDSITECKEALSTILDWLKPSRHEQDRLLFQLVAAWNCELVLALKELDSAAVQANNQIVWDVKSTEHRMPMVPSMVPKSFDMILNKMRTKIYPVILSIADFLPKKSVIRAMVLEKIRRGLDCISAEEPLYSWTIISEHSQTIKKRRIQSRKRGTE